MYVLLFEASIYYILSDEESSFCNLDSMTGPEDPGYPLS